jgi:hypothetical protein
MKRHLVLTWLAIMFAAPVLAHHGGGSFELNKTVSFPMARLTKMEFVNPHSWLYFEVTDADGRVTKHRCEMRSAHVLRRSGWSPDLFKIGERIDITASPDRADPASCYLQTIMFANGTRMDRYGQYVKAADGITEVRGPIKDVNVNRPLRRPSGEPNISGDWAPEQLVMADPRGVGGGLVRLGTIANATPGQRAGGGAGRRGAPPPGPRLYGGTTLTDAGEKAAAAFTQQDNPRFRCETTSIVFDWTFDGPVNRITQNKDTIVLQYGQLGFTRTVHMNMTSHPANVKGSRAGHSIGRWEKDVLIVDTLGFAPGVLSPPILNSDKLHVVERFSLDPNKNLLTRSYTAEDPVYFRGQFTGSDVIGVADLPYKPDPCKEMGFLDYSKEAKK